MNREDLAENRNPIVLVIDDEEPLRRIVVEALAVFGYDAVAASGAEEAWSIFEETPSLRVLICDVHLGEASGPSLVRELLRERPTLHVIFMSGGLDDLPFRQTDPFLRKPFDLISLRTALANVLERGQARINEKRIEGDRRRSQVA